MSNRTLNLDNALYQYLLDVSLREHPVLAELRAATRDHPLARMQIAPEQGQFMAMLARLLGVRLAIEIGVFTGYSTLAVALALPQDGTIVGCDINREYTDVAREYWRKAGVEQKIDLRIAPALDTLDALIDEGRSGGFDFAFIDADKTGYDVYYERCLTLVREGGLIVVDNVLWNGRVVLPAGDEDTAAIQAFNRKLLHDERIDLSMLAVGDGLTLARKRRR
ncbi:MAG TPA: class I SAM-dependent methyltransferase [Noviherbaspirillum sp.]|nr:class I SAM-dependent methyltransferase [Noviherbaspirillum sp.]